MHFLIKFTLLFIILGSFSLATFKSSNGFSNKSLVEKSFEKKEKIDAEKDFEPAILSLEKNLIPTNSIKFQIISQNKLKNIYLRNISPPPDFLG